MKRLIEKIFWTGIFCLVNTHEYLSYIGRFPDSDKEMARMRRKYDRVAEKYKRMRRKYDRVAEKYK